MPGPVSDSYDPEWGTSANASDIRSALNEMYDRVSGILDNQAPVYILDLVQERRGEFWKTLGAVHLTEWQWRIIRFALERAKDSL